LKKADTNGKLVNVFFDIDLDFFDEAASELSIREAAQSLKAAADQGHADAQ
jgi:hypothetical protein